MSLPAAADADARSAALAPLQRRWRLTSLAAAAACAVLLAWAWPRIPLAFDPVLNGSLGFAFGPNEDGCRIRVDALVQALLQVPPRVDTLLTPQVNGQHAA